MDDADNQPKAMLVIVGGATAPAIHTLNEHQPAYICFFVSTDSRPLIQTTIMPALSYAPLHYDWIVTPMPQNLLECYRALAEKLPGTLAKWGVSPEALTVEYTAGTKPMSVAAVLATIEASSQYFYTGAASAEGRDRAGIGIVLDGKEYTWFQTNPWEALAVPARREIALLFNHGRYQDAQERALRLARVSDPDMRRVYEALAELIDGYALWDRFEYKQAQAKISRALNALQLYVAGRPDPLRATLDVVGQQIDFLRGLLEKGEEAQRLDVLDMLANATRRAEMAQRYDDAAARLYAALEGLARYRLLSRYNIKTHAVQPGQIPEAVREEYLRRYSDPVEPSALLRLGLQAVYQLLAALNDEMGQRYLAHEDELSQLLQTRNQSRLAHGVNPIRPEVYARMRVIALDFAGANESELPRFPELTL